MFTKITIASVSISCTLILLEITSRIFFPIEYGLPPHPINDDVWRALLHQPSRIPGLFYELVPNISKSSHGVIVRTNSYGMRDKEPLSTKQTESLYRIVAVGDSFTFGLRVSGGSTYPNVLEELLQHTNSPYQFEVLNFGVSGYSTRDEAIQLKNKVIPLHPDLILIGYYLNDPEIEPLQPLQTYYRQPSWWQYFNLLRLIAKVKNNWDIRYYGNNDYYRYLHAPNMPKWNSVLTAFDEISSISKKENIPVLIIIFPKTLSKPWVDYPYQDIHKQVAEAAQQNALYVLDLYPAFSEYTPNDLMVIPGDPHPSELGHEVAAQEIFAWMEEHLHIFTNQN